LPKSDTGERPPLFPMFSRGDCRFGKKFRAHTVRRIPTGVSACFVIFAELNAWRTHHSFTPDLGIPNAPPCCVREARAGDWAGDCRYLFAFARCYRHLLGAPTRTKFCDLEYFPGAHPSGVIVGRLSSDFSEFHFTSQLSGVHSLFVLSTFLET